MRAMKLTPGQGPKWTTRLRQPVSEVDDAPAEEVDPASYRDLTKEEVLDGVAEGVRDFLEGNFRPADDCYDELGWQLADDET